VTSFDRGAVVGDLSDGDFHKLCQQIDGWSEGSYGSAEFKRQQCEIESALSVRLTRAGYAADYTAQCRQDAQACSDATRGKSNLTLRCVRGPERCARTVEDLELCLTDRSYNLYSLFLTAPMCDDICRVFDRLSLDATSCVAFEKACPGWLFTSRPAFPLLEQGVPLCGAAP
jgi:hypothetical protein